MGDNMRFEIVSLHPLYRGIGRSLDPCKFPKKTKQNYNEMLSCYFSYLDLMYSAEDISYDLDMFNHLLEYYMKFKNNDIECEIIAYDNVQLSDAFGKRLQLFGIDVVHEFAESLLEDPNSINGNIERILNTYGLLERPEDIDIVLKNINCGDIQWSPCWVYKVII